VISLRGSATAIADASPAWAAPSAHHVLPAAGLATFGRGGQKMWPESVWDPPALSRPAGVTLRCGAQTRQHFRYSGNALALAPPCGAIENAGAFSLTTPAKLCYPLDSDSLIRWHCQQRRFVRSPSGVANAKADTLRSRASPAIWRLRHQIKKHMEESNMPRKRTDREKVTVRIEPAILLEARKIARRDYGNESRISPVVEDALTKYVAAELDEGAIKSILSATEGALYNRISQKVEKEMDKLLERVGDLTAKSSFEIILTGYISKALFLSNPKFSQTDYEELRKLTVKRMKKNYGVDEIAKLADENKSLSDQLVKQEKEIERIRKEYEEKLTAKERETEEQKRQASEKQRQIVKYYMDMVNYISKHQSKSMIGKTQLEKPVDQLVEEYKAQKRR
jgi:hypothetical protein